MLPSMTVCPKYESAYKEEELVRHGIGSQWVGKHIIYLRLSDSRNIVEEISKETLPRMKEIYLRM